MYRGTIRVWLLAGNGGMGYGDYCRGLYRDYYRDPFPHSLLRTRQISAPQIPLILGSLYYARVLLKEPPSEKYFLDPSAGLG